MIQFRICTDDKNLITLKCLDERKVQRRAAVQPILQFPCKEVDLYNLKSNTWLKGPEMNVARASFGSAVFNSKIYAVGKLI